MFNKSEIKHDSDVLLFGSGAKTTNSPAGPGTDGLRVDSPLLATEEFFESVSRDAIAPGKLEDTDAPPSIAVPTDRERALRQLQNADYLDLLDAVDKLRVRDLGAKIQIPQIVVCGIQSSGKSAVLEAISHLPFPSGSGTKTRFATELILRNSPLTSITASIELHHAHNRRSKNPLSGFKTLTSSSLDDFASFHREARRYLEKHNAGSKGAFWFDRLKIEVSGPDQPQLTLVDLPGLISANFNEAENDSKDVERLVESYIESPRAIVLAVFAGNIDVDNQGIANLIKRKPEIHERTLGVITFLDMPMTEDKKQALLDLANNQNLRAGLGWHLVCNLNHEAIDRSTLAREQHESKYLNEQPWTSLSLSQRGIGNLRERLSTSLFEVIQKELPNLRTDVQEHITKNEKILSNLGDLRSNPLQHKAYLTDVASKLGELVRVALNGHYDTSKDPEFFAEHRSHQLRESINLASDEFAIKIQKSWRYILHAEEDFGPSLVKSGIDGSRHAASTDHRPHEPIPFGKPLDDGVMQSVDTYQFCQDLVAYMKQSRGKLMRGEPNAQISTSIVKLQCICWAPICKAYVERCYNFVCDFLTRALRRAAGLYTGSLIWKELGQQFMNDRYHNIRSKLDEMLWQHQYSHRAMLGEDSSLVNAAWRSGKGQLRVAGLADSQMTVHEMEIWDALKLIDQAAHYSVIKLSALMDNVAVLVVERWLLTNLGDIFSARNLVLMDDDTISKLGQESEADEAARRAAEEEIEALQEVAKICSTHGKLMLGSA